MKYNLILSLAALCWTLPIWASGESEYLDFFAKYDSLYKNFDVAVVELYADDAMITAVRSMPNGTEQTLKIDGKRWKQMILDSMEIAEQREDQSRFSNIKVEMLGERVKITASRYSTVKCFQDDRFFLMARKDPDGQIRIVEEFSESPLESSCENRPENDLELVLQGAASLLSKQLPIQVDEDTRLEKASSKGDVLTLHYVLFNYAAEDLDLSTFAADMRPGLVQQTCGMPNFKTLVDQGGTLAYVYSGMNGGEIAAIRVEGKDCVK